VTILFTIYFVVIRELHVLGILYGDLIGASMVLLCSLFFLRNYLVRRFSPAILKQMLRFGMPLVPAMLAFWVLRVSDRYFLQHYSSTHEVGLYAMGVRFAFILELLFYAPFNNNWPAVYFRVAKQENAREEFSSIFTYFLLVICFFALAISIFSRPAIHIMTTTAFYDAYEVVPILILATIFLGIYTNVTVGVGITGKTEYHAGIVMIAALVNIALNFLLIPLYGMLGAALATVIAYGVKMVVGYVVGMKLYPIRYDFSRLIKITAAFCVPFVAHGLLASDSLFLEITLDFGLLASYLLLLVAFRFFSLGEINWMKLQWDKAKRGFAEATVLNSKL
jgi:O-antigen/teichoic acid export membrane protein